jgi:hypothetical protein
MNVCYRVQQDLVGKDKYPFVFVWISGIDDPRRALFTILYKWTILFV